MLIDYVSNKYPAMVGSVIVLNFGWMYQGIWQMIKLILTENAKQKISFPKPAELANLIDREDILQGKAHMTFKANNDRMILITYPKNWEESTNIHGQRRVIRCCKSMARPIMAMETMLWKMLLFPTCHEARL